MIKGKALSTGFVSLLGERNSRSLIDGKVIPHEEYLRSFDTGNFLPIFQKDQLPTEFGGGGASPKVFANLVLMPPHDVARQESRTILDLVLQRYENMNPSNEDLLQSQLLPPAGGNLISKDIFAFLEMRSEMIWQAMIDFTEGADESNGKKSRP